MFLSGPVHVGPMGDLQDLDHEGLVVDLVHDPVAAPPGAMAVDERPEQPLADSMGVFGERPGAELDDRRRHRLGQALRDRLAGSGLEPDLVVRRVNLPRHDGG